ncbi:MAG TPA: hypothetical protein VNW54_01880 [Granulicella sp.]|nr:hypothetical protein [Granulicella sp.]
MDDDHDRVRGAEVVGYLLGYAHMTNTRMLALLGDPEADCYELLFSFSSIENKQRFLELVQSNSLTATEPDQIMVPSEDEIREARPLAMVLSKDVMDHSTLVAMTLTMESESDLSQ